MVTFFVKKTLNNKSVKGDRGAICLTKNMSELLRWMVADPEIARLILEFEASQEFIKADRDQEPNKRHHEQAIGVQACLCFTLSQDMIRHLDLVEQENILHWRPGRFGDVTSTFNSAQ